MNVEVSETPSLVDIHCHLVPGMDDGPASWAEALEMVEIAVADGFGTMIVTPHQLGNYSHNTAVQIRKRVAELQAQLDQREIALQVLPGADVRIEANMIASIVAGEVLTLGGHGRHVLLELPHELYFPLEPLLDQLAQAGLVGILSHPERNQGLLREPQIVKQLADRGCLMQVTAASLLGGFGAASREMSEWLVCNQVVHFLATDAHGSKSRRPLMRRARQRAMELVGKPLADAMCCHNPADVAAGRDVPPLPRQAARKQALAGWLPWRRAS